MADEMAFRKGIEGRQAEQRVLEEFYHSDASSDSRVHKGDEPYISAWHGIASKEEFV